MLRDIDYFESRLGKLGGFEDAGEYLRTIAKSKEVVSAPPPPETSAVEETHGDTPGGGDEPQASSTDSNSAPQTSEDVAA